MCVSDRTKEVIEKAKQQQKRPTILTTTINAAIQQKRKQYVFKSPHIRFVKERPYVIVMYVLCPGLLN